MKEKKEKLRSFLRLITMSAVFAVCLIFTSAHTYAADKVDGYFIYDTVTYNGYTTAYIKGYNGTASGDLIIPDTVGGYPVTCIYNNAFKGQTGFEGDLYIPDSVRAIYPYAFENCGFEGDLYISKNCQYIGMMAFSGGKFKGTITIPDSLATPKIGDWIDYYSLGNEKAGVTKAQYNYDYAGVSNPFYGCNSAEKIINKSDISFAYDNCFSSDTTRLKETGSGVYATKYVSKGTWVRVKAVTSISLNKTVLGLKKGASETLTATIAPADADDKRYTWKSSDENIVKVDKNGNVTAISLGTATVTAVSTDGGKTATCTVTVSVPVEKIQINKSSLSFRRGDSEKLTAEVFPADATEKTVSWTSSDSSIAKVDSTGSVIAVGRGTATIVAASADGEIKDVCTVTVGLYDEWEVIGDKSYWYEENERQGTSSDSKCFWYEGTLRGREIYDAASDGWYWLDVNADGAKATGKEVFMPYIYQQEDSWSDDEKIANANASDDGLQAYVLECIRNKTGKWVRYDNNGKMLKGWVTISGTLANLYPDQKGNTYYYDYKTGLMAKGWITLNGTTYHFDEVTGALLGY